MIQVSAHYASSGCDRASQEEVSTPVPSGHRPSEQTHEPICIVDDDESVADSLKVLLEIFGFDVQSYGSGADFLADDRRRTAGCLVIDLHSAAAQVRGIANGDWVSIETPDGSASPRPAQR